MATLKLEFGEFMGLANTVTVLFEGTSDKSVCLCHSIAHQLTLRTNNSTINCPWCGAPMEVKEILYCVDENDKLIKGLSQEAALAFWKTLPDAE